MLRKPNDADIQVINEMYLSFHTTKQIAKKLGFACSTILKYASPLAKKVLIKRFRSYQVKRFVKTEDVAEMEALFEQGYNPSQIAEILNWGIKTVITNIKYEPPKPPERNIVIILDFKPFIQNEPINMPTIDFSKLPPTTDAKAIEYMMYKF